MRISARDVSGVIEAASVAGHAAVELPSAGAAATATVFDASAASAHVQARRTALEGLDAILGPPDQPVTLEDATRALEHASVLAAMPDDPRTLRVSPRHLAELRRAVSDSGRPGGSTWGLGSALDALRVDVQRIRLAEQPGLDKRSLTHEVMELVRRPDDQLDTAHLQRILAALSTSDDRRVALHGLEVGGSWAHGRALPTTNDRVRSDLVTLRAWADRVDDVETAEAAAVADPRLDRHAAATELERIAALPGTTIADGELLRIAALDALPEDRRPAEMLERVVMPRADYIGGRTANGELLAALRVHAERARLVRGEVVDRSAFERDAARILTTPPAELVPGDLVRLAALDSLPTSLRPRLPDSQGTFWRLARNVQRDPAAIASAHTTEQLGRLRVWALVHTPEGEAALRARIRAGEPIEPWTAAELARRGPDAIARVGTTAEQLLDASIDAMRCNLSHELRRAHLDAVTALLGTVRFPEDADAAAAHAARILHLDDATPRAAVDRIRSLPTVDVRYEHARTLALVESLPPAVLGDALPPGTTWRQPMLHDDALGTTANLDRAHEELALWAERAALERELLAQAADEVASAAPAQLDVDAARILLKPESEITIGDRRRLTAMAQLPDGMRPATLPDDPALLSTGYSAYGGSQVNADLDALRLWARSTPTGREHAISAARDAGGAMTSRIVAALLAQGPTALTEADVTARQLLPTTLRGLRELVGSDRVDTLAALQAADGVLALLPLEQPAHHALAGSARDLLQRNVERLEYRRSGGYAWYPDYAEVGRAISQMELLERTLDMGTSARAGAESLVW